MTDSIEKQIELKATVSRVWRALTDYREFGEWFRIKLEGPFVAGQLSQGQILNPGYEHMILDITPQTIQPETFFSYTWHPFAFDPSVDYSQETPTLVEFWLEEIPIGTRLTVKESGFDKIPAERRLKAFEMNDRGWAGQIRNIETYLARA